MSNTLEQTIVEDSSLLNDIVVHENDLSEQVKTLFNYHDQILRTFQMNRRSIVDNELLTSVGRHLFLSRIDQMYKNCKEVLNYMAANSELLEQNLPDIGPLFICGLPRTSSTLLYNLLACDKNCRAPLYIDMHIDPTPPITRSNIVEQERRINKVEVSTQQIDQLTGHSSSAAASHATFPIEQDFWIMEQTGISLQLMVVSPLHENEMEDFFYDKMNKNFVYAYHETFLRILNSVDKPQSHWLLKSPAHSLYLDVLLDRYPRAQIVMTHRRLDGVIPSFCSLMWQRNHFRLNKDDSRSRTTLVTRSLRHLDKMIERIVQFHNRSHYVRKPIVHINYDDLMKQPIVTVRHIYDYFGLDFSNEFEMAMSNWLRDNPQDKQGRHTYNLTDYGLVYEQIEVRYANYIALFLGSSA